MDWHPVTSVQQQTPDNDFCHFSITNVCFAFWAFFREPEKLGSHTGSKWWPGDPDVKDDQMIHWPGDPTTQFHVWCKGRGSFGVFMLGNDQTCSRSTFPTLFARAQKRCGLWQPVYWSSLLYMQLRRQSARSDIKVDCLTNRFTMTRFICAGLQNQSASGPAWCNNYDINSAAKVKSLVDRQLRWDTATSRG